MEFLVVHSLLCNLVLLFSTSVLHFFPTYLVVLKYISIALKLFSSKDKFQVVNIFSLGMSLLDNSQLSPLNMFVLFLSACLLYDYLLTVKDCHSIQYSRGVLAVQKADDFKHTFSHIQYCSLDYCSPCHHYMISPKGPNLH